MAGSKADARTESIQLLPVAKLRVSDFNVRADVRPEDVDDLAADIGEKRRSGAGLAGTGILNALHVRERGRGEFEVYQGARRLAAAKRLGLKEVPCVVKDLSDRDAVAASFSENDQRKDMDPVTRALAVRRMLEMKSGGKSLFRELKDVAEAIGRSKQVVSDLMAILRLDPAVQRLVQSEDVSYTAAVAMGYRLKDAGDQRRVAEVIRGMKTGEQRRIVDHVSDDPALLALSGPQLKENLEALLTDFSSEERRHLRALYKRCGLDPDGIKWSRMTRAQYEKEVAAKRAYLERRKERVGSASGVAGSGSNGVKGKARSKGDDDEAPARTRLASAPVHREVHEVDDDINAVFEGIRDFYFDLELGGQRVRVAAGEVGLSQSDFLRLKGSLASHIVTEDLVDLKRLSKGRR